MVGFLLTLGFGNLFIFVADSLRCPTSFPLGRSHIGLPQVGGGGVPTRFSFLCEFLRSEKKKETDGFISDASSFPKIRRFLYQKRERACVYSTCGSFKS